MVQNKNYQGNFSKLMFLERLDNYCIYYYLFQVINKIIPIRMTEHEELLGADFFEHDIRHPGVGVSRAISVLKNYDEEIDCTIPPTTMNKGSIF